MMFLPHEVPSRVSPRHIAIELLPHSTNCGMLRRWRIPFSRLPGLAEQLHGKLRR